MKSYILLEVEVPEYCNDCGGSDQAKVTSKQFEFDEMLNDPHFRQQLIERGWADASAIQDLSDKDLGPRLVLLSNHNSYSGSNGYVTGSLVDSKNASSVSNTLSYGNSFFAVELNEHAVQKICPEGYDRYKKIMAQRKAAQKAAEASALKRKQTAELKKKNAEKNKIENAKKLLLNAGIKVEM